MKCKYRFSIEGRFFLDASVPIPTKDWIVEFVPSAGHVTHIEVTVPIPQAQDWPRITREPTPGVKLHIETNAHRLPWVQRELRSLQGLLAVFGFHSINLEHPSIEWIHETEEERDALPLQSFSTKRTPLPDHEIPPVSFDLAARAVMACDAATDVELPLNFFRRGMLDFHDRNYIEAIYDFFFVLENQYADGQFKKFAVLEAFSRSEELCSFVEQVITTPSVTLQHEASVQVEFNNSYGRMTVSEALNRVVELRGRLHHQTPKRRDNWHPEDQSRYEVDALFLQAVSHKIVFSLAGRYIWDKAVVSEYQALAIAHGHQPVVG